MVYNTVTEKVSFNFIKLFISDAGCHCTTDFQPADLIGKIGKWENYFTGNKKFCLRPGLVR